jgi:signal transduction histidine kinase
VELLVADDRIEVTDDGHGMSLSDFRGRWMRIGTTRKEAQRTSPELGRPLTGSKGVGRLAAQLLAHELTITTVGLKDPGLSGWSRRLKAERQELHRQVTAHINWDEAIEEDQLTDVGADVRTKQAATAFAGGSPCGTRIALTRLKAAWSPDRFRQLAQELWSLQPPMEVDKDDDAAFRVVIESEHSEVVEEFRRQMKAILGIWEVKVTGSLRPATQEDAGDVAELRSVPDVPGADLAVGELSEPMAYDAGLPDEVSAGRVLDVTVRFKGGPTKRVSLKMAPCLLDQVTYEIRIFDLQHRQPKGIKVGLARDYLKRYGGVHIYDAGFHLPYYGHPEQDWLGIEAAHAHRLSASRLLPKELQVRRGLLDLPTNARIFGSVYVSTTHEAQVASDRGTPEAEALAVQVTRDRLVANESFRQLRDLVRAGIDLYAMEKARQKFKESQRRRQKSRKPSAPINDIKEALEKLRDVLPKEDAAELAALADEAATDVAVLEEASRDQASLLGALATAGMTSLAYDHELSKQLAAVRHQVKELRRIAKGAGAGVREDLVGVAEALRKWSVRAQRLRALFAPLLDEEARTRRGRFKARDLIGDVASQVDVLARGTAVSADRVPKGLHLPDGAYAAWSAVFQNLLINAFNAVIDADERRVDISGGRERGRGWIRVQDTGTGIDLAQAERFFEPFERGAAITPERAALGLGGSGLGLTIVRMILSELDCDVAFEVPESQYSTAIRISWMET